MGDPEINMRAATTSLEEGYRKAIKAADAMAAFKALSSKPQKRFTTVEALRAKPGSPLWGFTDQGKKA